MQLVNIVKTKTKMLINTIPDLAEAYIFPFTYDEINKLDPDSGLDFNAFVLGQQVVLSFRFMPEI